MISTRRRFIQTAAGSLLLPAYGAAIAQATRTLSVERRPPAQQARADAELNAAGRQALIIGNGAYKGITPLHNPPNDARAMGEQLRSSGFQVDVRLDMTREAMLDAIGVFTRRIAATRSVGLFFYAGHGLQLAFRNFLVPVDADIGEVDDIPKGCVDLNALMAGVARAGNPMNIVILDACRDNPFQGVRLEGRGLAQFDAPVGSLLAYATSPGNVASDGAGQNGLYTENLLRELKVPEARIEDVFKRVRLGVRRKSNGRQIPWETTSLEEDFYFLPPRQFVPVNDSQENRRFEEELVGWEQIKGAKELAPVEEYLRRYPSGRFSELAQLRLDQLLAAQGEKKIRQETAPNPYSQGTGLADTAYKVGDSYTFRVMDSLTGVEQQRITETVTQITDDEVRYSSGRITDLLGNSRRNPDGQTFTAQQNYPSEFRVGKRWSVRTMTESRGIKALVEIDFVVTGREKLTIEAGTFNAFVVEGRGVFSFSGGSGSNSVKFWFEPDKVRRPLVSEEVRRIGTRYALTRRLELASYKQS